MAVSRSKSWIDKEVLTHSDLNAEFNNILNNGEDLAWPATKAKDLDGFELILDSDGDTSITADTDDQIDIRIAGADDFKFTANTFAALSGSVITTNTINETTSATGVNIDGLLIKDLTIASHIIGVDLQAFDSDTAKLDVDQSWTGTQSNTFLELTDAGPVVVDFATANNFYVTVAADREIGAPSNKTIGQAGTFIVEQSSGGDTTTWHADWDFGDVGNPTPDETAAKKAIISYVVDWDSVVNAVFAGNF